MLKVEHSTTRECEDYFLGLLSDITDMNVPWMGVVFYVKNGEVYIKRTTCSFPTDDFDAVIDLLRKNLDEEVSINTNDLPMAEHLKISEDKGNGEFIQGSDDLFPPLGMRSGENEDV